jgi:hypothetical protein
VLQFFGYRCTFNRQPHQPQIEAMPHDDEIRPKLAIIPASLLLGQNGLAQSLLARPCLLFQPNLERPEKEIRDFADKNALNEFVMQIQ